MSLATLTRERQGVLRHSPWDALLVALAAAHGLLLLLVPAAPVLALGLWWNSNTIAHYFIHKPFFRARILNVFFSVYLSLLLGIPQELWRARHLRHHFGAGWKGQHTRLLVVEAVLIAVLWGLLLVGAPLFFLT